MARVREISNQEDVLDSRDIIARIAALDGTDDEDEMAELAALVALQEEAEDYSPDWTHGATLIRDSYFKDYAIELAVDIGAVHDDLSWPLACIDWYRAARELQMDYTAVDFNGVTYWVR